MPRSFSASTTSGLISPVGAEPEICKYEKLHEKPGPFYIEDDWYAR